MDDTVFPKELVEKIGLKNGLFLNLYDRSRRVAGDRWYVCLVGEIEIAYNRDTLISLKDRIGDEVSEGDIDSFIKETKGRIVFEIKKERNFIDEREKDNVFSMLLSSLKKDALPYMNNPSFADGYLINCFKEYIKKKDWWK